MVAAGQLAGSARAGGVVGNAAQQHRQATPLLGYACLSRVRRFWVACRQWLSRYCLAAQSRLFVTTHRSVNSELSMAWVIRGKPARLCSGRRQVWVASNVSKCHQSDQVPWPHAWAHALLASGIDTRLDGKFVALRVSEIRGRGSVKPGGSSVFVAHARGASTW